MPFKDLKIIIEGAPKSGKTWLTAVIIDALQASNVKVEHLDPRGDGDLDRKLKAIQDDTEDVRELLQDLRSGKIVPTIEERPVRR